jgi:putative DNA primase/helicase
MTPNTMLDVALEHARRGWAVFPLAPGTKRPLIAKASGGNGCKDATTDEAKIREWWQAEPRANVGIATGKISGIDVLDPDGEAGADTAKKLAKEFGGFGDTLRVRTPNGWHIYFRHRPGLKNKTRILGPDSGLDLRTDGGYVVAPGSVVGGTTYVAKTAFTVTDWPEWMHPFLPQKGTKHATRATHGAAPDLAGFTPYGKAAFHSLTTEIQQARPGTRNETVNRIAFRAGQLHAAGEIPDCLDSLIGLCPVNDDFSLSEATKTATRGWQDGLAHPRGAPPRTTTHHHEPEPEAEQPPEPTPERLTDLGNARRLVRMFGKDLRFTSTHGWFVWDGTRWAKDDLNVAQLRAKAAVESLWEEIAYAPPDERKALVRHASGSQSNRGIQACLALAASEPETAIRFKEFDQHAGLINCPNGILELKTGILHPHGRDFLITRLTGAEYDAAAACPSWTTFLEQILPDPATRAFVQKYAGYSLSGSKTAQCFAFLYGTGANGKSTFLDTLCNVFGDYAISTPFDTFLARQAGQATNDLARLAGARLVRASEPDEGVTFSESTIKTATGGEPISARFLHREFFDFTPEFALWLSGNHQPRVKGTDHGIWRRIRLVPFTVRIDKPDETLKDRLMAESKGILAWAVAGYQAYLRDGMAPPEAIKTATAQYRQDQDTLGQFLEDRCVLGVEQTVAVTKLREVYKQWCDDTDEFAVSQRRFKARLMEHGCVQSSTGKARFWRGIGVVDEYARASHD